MSDLLQSIAIIALAAAQVVTANSVLNLSKASRANTAAIGMLHIRTRHDPTAIANALRESLANVNRKRGQT